MKSGTGTSNATARGERPRIIHNDEATLAGELVRPLHGRPQFESSRSRIHQLHRRRARPAFDPLNFSTSVQYWSESSTDLRYRDNYQLMTQNVLSGTGAISYTSSTLEAFGNNGTTPANGLINSGSNTDLAYMTSAAGYNPTQSQILTALTTASDHLPNVADYSFSLPLPATIGLHSALSATIITGGTANLGATVANTAAGGSSSLNFTLTAAVPSGDGAWEASLPAPAPSRQREPGLHGFRHLHRAWASPWSRSPPAIPMRRTIRKQPPRRSQCWTTPRPFCQSPVATAFWSMRRSRPPATVSLSNAPGTRSDLQVGSVPTIGSGTLGNGPAAPYYVPPGTATGLYGHFNAGDTPGAFSDTVTFASAGDRQSLPGGTIRRARFRPITGNVYSGKAQWNATSGDWTTANWLDTVGGGPSAALGLAGYATDTATFGTAVGSGTAVVSLNSAAPVLSNLIFSNSNASYMLVQGTGATGLILTGTDSQQFGRRDGD